MDDIIYCVYDGNEFLAGFQSLAIAVDFAENWRANSLLPIFLVAAETGEVIDEWRKGRWEMNNL